MKVIITLKKSVIGSKPEQYRYSESSRSEEDQFLCSEGTHPQIQGMVHAVRHLVECKEAE